MKALRTSGERQVEVLDLPVPQPEPGEVVIEMKSTGICGSDLHPYRHPTPLAPRPGFISGHEPCGVIAEIGQGVTGWKVGDRVVPYFRRTCGQCFYCRAGRRERLRQPPRLVRPPGLRRLAHRVHARRGAVPDARCPST